MEAGKRKMPGGGKAPASSAASGPTQQHPRRFVRAERRGGRGAGRGGGGRGGGRGGGNQAGSRAGPPAGGGARGVTDPKLKDKYLDFYRTLSPTIKKVAGRVLHSVSKPQLSLLTKEKVQKRTEETDVDLDEATSRPSKKKQKKSVSITETKKEERRSVKKRKLALDEEEGENGRALLVPITGEGEKKKKDKAEHQKKKRKLDLATCDETQEEEEVPEKPWLTSITLYMDSPQSRLSSPIKVVRREVAWPTEHVVLPRSQAQVRSVLQKHGKGHWGPIPLSPSLTLVVEKLAKTGIMSVGQMHSYNFWLKTQQALVCHRKVVQLAPQLAQLYRSGQSIVELSAKYDLPPVSLFRAIISARDNLSKVELKRAMSEESELDERDRLELAKARETDMITTDQRPGQLANADLFEAEIEKYLRSNCIRFKRQDELTQEQTHFFQAPFSTPDFLLVDEVFINGHQVRWIDAKNYYGSSDVNMQIQSMKKQANRYVEYWGPGAIVFALSYCSELALPASVLKLDASSFSTAIPLDAYSK